MDFFRVANFEHLQHYKDRSPPWIKLYNDLMDDYNFACLQDASKLHLIMIFLLASRTDNKIPCDSKWISSRISATQEVNLDALFASGFIEKISAETSQSKAGKPASAVLAPCQQDARPEGEGEGEREREKSAPGKPDGDPPPADKPEKKTPITLKTYLAQRKEENKPPFDPDDRVYKYAESIALPDEMLALAWFEFQERHAKGRQSSKRYSAWNQAFENSLRDRWYKLWYLDNASGQYILSTDGQQAKRNMEAKRTA